MRRLLRAVMIPVMERYFQPHLARLRRELGLPPRAHLLLEAMRGGAVNLGLWSPHLRGALPDDPPGGRICGYAWHDRHGDVEAPPDDVRRFLEEGEPPILFCLGTAAVHVAGDFYDHAAAACARIGRRGLLLMGPGRVPARRWPAGVRAFEYAPFSSVMPRCAVNVHHGGIGSTGQALRAGRPTVVIPHAHDQWDNAARVLRLGVSRTLPRSRVTARSLARVLAGVAESAPMADTARDLARRMEGEDGARAAAAHVETLAAVPGGAGDAG
jgi:UDP:flavonoid glycosyltransferase YjiC (YdhE family)